MSDRGEDIIKAMQESIEWSKGNSKAKVTQYVCPKCDASVTITKEVGKEDLPLLCDLCSA